jgi:hypothetical protein
MTPPKKPEWFQLAESDGGKAHTSVKRSARGALLALPLLPVTTLASAAPSMSANVALANPSIAIPPTGGEDNDDDYEEEDDEEDEGDDD